MNYGLVPDLREKTIQITQEMNIEVDVSYLIKEGYNGVSAHHFGFNKHGDIGSAIFVKDGLERHIIDFNFGHESIHAIRYLGLESQFLEFLRKKGFALNPFETFRDEEQIAHVGGLISLHNRLVIWFYSHPDFDSVKKALMDSRI